MSAAAVLESDYLDTKPVAGFLPRYSYWWDRAFVEAGLSAAERLVTISAMRAAKWDGDGRCYLEWSNAASAKQVGFNASTASRAKKHLRSAGLIELVQPGSHVTHVDDLYDVSVLAQNRRPQ
jgi:hypothetical protein